MKNCKPTVFWGVAVLGAILFALSLVFETSLTISLMPPTLRALRTAAAGAAVLGAVCALYLTLKRKSERKHAEEEKKEQAQTKRVSRQYADDNLNPENIRRQFDRLQGTNPGEKPLIDRSVLQMDRIDGFQERLNNLLSANQAEYLRDTVDALDIAEEKMCRNYRKLINMLLILEDGKTFGEEGRKQALGYLDENDRILEKTRKLLKLAADMINQRGGGNSRDQLDAWIQSMQESLEEK